MENEKDIKTILDAEIRGEISELSQMEMGTEVYKTAIEGVTKLMGQSIELHKLEAERDEKLKQRRKEWTDLVVKHGVTLVLGIAGIGLTVWGTHVSLDYEKTGTISTSIGRMFNNRLVPRN